MAQYRCGQCGKVQPGDGMLNRTEPSRCANCDAVTFEPVGSAGTSTAQLGALVGALVLISVGIGQLAGIGILGEHPQAGLSGVLSLVVAGYLLLKAPAV